MSLRDEAIPIAVLALLLLVAAFDAYALKQLSLASYQASLDPESLQKLAAGQRQRLTERDERAGAVLFGARVVNLAGVSAAVLLLLGAYALPWKQLEVEGEETAEAEPAAKVRLGAVFDAATEVSIRRRAEERLRASEALTRSIVETVVDGILTFDARGSIKTANATVGALFGRGPSSLIGRSVAELIPAFGPGQPIDLQTTSIVQLRREVTGRRADGSSFPIELGMSQLQTEDGLSYTAIVRDITERRELERLKNEFVATVSHELRTPVTSIHGSLALLAGGVSGELPEEARSLVDIALLNAERLSHLVNDILEVEKIAAGKMSFDIRSHGLAGLLERAVDTNRVYAQQLGVAFDILDHIPQAQVLVDADRFLQVMTNLLSNAAKFSPEGQTVRITALSSNGRARIQVTDGGPGIPEEFRPRIFQRFAQGDASDTRQRGGTGLGLSISKAIVEGLGGEIGFETRVGFGSTFWFEVPAMGTHT